MLKFRIDFLELRMRLLEWRTDRQMKRLSERYYHLCEIYKKQIGMVE